jgi:hypothetical protein
MRGNCRQRADRVIIAFMKHVESALAFAYAALMIALATPFAALPPFILSMVFIHDPSIMVLAIPLAIGLGVLAKKLTAQSIRWHIGMQCIGPMIAAPAFFRGQWCASEANRLGRGVKAPGFGMELESGLFYSIALWGILAMYAGIIGHCRMRFRDFLDRRGAT